MKENRIRYTRMNEVKAIIVHHQHVSFKYPHEINPSKEVLASLINEKIKSKEGDWTTPQISYCNVPGLKLTKGSLT